MVPSGPPTPIGGAQSVTPSLLRSNSGLLGGQGGPMPSQEPFPSLVSPRTQFNNMNLLGNVPNVSSLLSQSFGNGGTTSGPSGPGTSQRGGIATGAESDPLSGVGNGMAFNLTNSSSSGQVVQGQRFSIPSGSNPMLPDQLPSQQLEPQKHSQQPLQQFSGPLNSQSQQQQQCHSIRGGLGSVAPVKLEPQVTNDQHGQQQQLQSLRSLGQVKLEPEQLQTMRNLTSVKMEPQHLDQSLFLNQQQQQQQQQLLQMSMSRQNSQAVAAAQLNLLHQHRLLHLQQQQQQHQILKALPQQRSQLQQQFQTQNLGIRSPVKPAYEPGMCARRLTQYMYQQQQRPDGNNIEFWRKFVAEFFAPNAKKKWCVSMYGNGRQTSGVFPQDAWHCEICDCKPGRGFEATVEVLPRLFKIKYESGTVEELLYVDMPHEYQNPLGQIVLDYAKAIQESVFDQLRVVRDGQLRIVFSPDLKICSWEFCARRHEELIPRKLLIPQVSQLGIAAQKYQAATQNSSSNASVTDLQSNCNMFVASARQLRKALEVPLVNDLGYTKRYVRCLQISEVVNSMKDLIDYSRLTGAGPMESLAKVPRRTSTSSGPQGQNQPPEDQQQQLQQHQQAMVQNTINDESCVQAAGMHAASSNGMASVNNSFNTTSASTSSTIAGLLHPNSNSRQQNPMSNASNPYGGSSMPSPGSSSTMQQAQPNPSPFQSPTPSSSNNPQLAATNLMGSANLPANLSMQHPALSSDGDANDSQSSVQKIIQEMMLSSQFNSAGGMMGVASMGTDVKNMNGGNLSFNGGNCLVPNGTTNSNPIIGGAGFGGMGGGPGQSAMINGIRTAIGNNTMPMNGRVGISSMPRDQSISHQQQDLGNQLLSGLGVVNGFNNLQFDWKPSP
ncbi:hypothetical protein Nepgr_002720 [Nepenthes gracilis]|uniref:Transcriptional corepressor SEUSS n=1 Tax=Nepenthes gracilis TaxID=150966 RepID=A0AAD3P6R0_NEPGR|nr:hypothetical protein Nepgr_002720 [Nepenthes gracilis]